jgi:hypothetical protein
VRQVVLVLHADDGRDRLRLVELPGGDVADAEVPDQSLLPQLGEHAEGFGERHRHGVVAGVVAEPQVHHIERVDA